MKNILKLMALFAMMLCITSCSEDDAIVDPQLEVTAANLNGVWMLAEWNGAPLAEGSYCYLVFNRKDNTFSMYQKFDSMYTRHITGEFSIKKDRLEGYIISGYYDYDNGEWNHKYIVTNLVQSGSMIWTAKDQMDDVTKYVRVSEVPVDILAGTRNSQGAY